LRLLGTRGDRRLGASRWIRRWRLRDRRPRNDWRYGRTSAVRYGRTSAVRYRRTSAVLGVRPPGRDRASLLFLDTQREYPVQLGELRVERGLLLYETSQLFIPRSPDILPLLVGVLTYRRSQLGFLTRFTLL